MRWRCLLAEKDQDDIALTMWLWLGHQSVGVENRIQEIMNQITQPKPDSRERVRIATKKDFDVSYFCGSGAGGQARNKVASGVQIIHRETGAIGRASDSRSQADNKAVAFDRLLATPKMKFWLTAKVFEVRQGETLQAQIERDCRDENMKYEIKNALGQWEEVNADYFEGVAAKGE